MTARLQYESLHWGKYYYYPFFVGGVRGGVNRTAGLAASRHGDMRRVEAS